VQRVGPEPVIEADWPGAQPGNGGAKDLTQSWHAPGPSMPLTGAKYATHRGQVADAVSKTAVRPTWVPDGGPFCGCLSEFFGQPARMTQDLPGGQKAIGLDISGLWIDNAVAFRILWNHGSPTGWSLPRHSLV